MFVYRNPLENTIAEFHRQHSGNTGSIKSLSRFRQKAKETMAKTNITLLQKIYHEQIEIGHLILNRTKEFDKPLLVMSYSDLKKNLLPQLLRVAHFVGLDEDPDILERALCTVYSAKQTASQTKRAARFDSKPVALSILNRTEIIQDIIDADVEMRHRKIHYLMLDETLRRLKI